MGNPTDYKGIKVFYDTSVLLRLLGCSGSELETATLEMHDSLSSLGCDLHYFDVNRAEVSNILDSILNAHAYGHEIFGETGEAIVNGGISVAQVRDLAATFETRLAQLNVFSFEYDYRSRKNEDAFQINELDLADAIVAAAVKSDRGYKRENALNDSKAIATVVRLRKGRISKELARSWFVFVSQNSLLQRATRKFCVEHLQEYDESAISPVVTVGQITTAGWLATERALEPHKVSKELLGNCYSAVRPSAAWADEFANALEQFSAEDKEILEKRADAALILKATREAVKDQSLNEAAVLRKINVAEIFRQAAATMSEAEKTRSRQISDLSVQYAAEKDEALRHAAATAEEDRLQAVKDAEEKISIATADKIKQAQTYRNQERAEAIAQWFVGITIVLFILAMVALAIADKWQLFAETTLLSRVLSIFAVGAATLGILDLCGLRPIGHLVDKVRNVVSLRVFRILQDEKLW